MSAHSSNNNDHGGGDSASNVATFSASLACKKTASSHSKVAFFNQLAEKHEQSRERNAFSDNWETLKKTRSTLIK